MDYYGTDDPAASTVTFPLILPDAPSASVTLLVRSVPLRSDETILSTNPFEAWFAFNIYGDTLAVTVDQDLSIVEVTRHGSGSD